MVKGGDYLLPDLYYSVEGVYTVSGIVTIALYDPTRTTESSFNGQFREQDANLWSL